MASNFYKRYLYRALCLCIVLSTGCQTTLSAIAATAAPTDDASSEENAKAPEAAPAAAAPGKASEATAPVANAPAAPPVKKPYSDEAVKHYNKGVELQQTGFLNQAITEYRGAIESDDRMEEAWSNLGTIYAAQRSYQKAAEAYQKALTLKPDRPTTLNGLGTVLYARGKIEEAKTTWRAAIVADPKFASAYYNMANALEGEHKTTEAVREYVKAIEVNPGMGDSFYRIATLYLKEAHPAQARVMFAKAVFLGPEAEYIRDAMKQLSALDATFAGDVADRREPRTTLGPAPAVPKDGATKEAPAKEVIKEASAASAIRPKAVPKATPKAAATPAADAPQLRNKTKENQATPSTGINIKTDANGMGTVTDQPDTEKTKKKKKEKEPKEAREPKEAKEPKPPKEPKPAREPKPPREPKVKVRKKPDPAAAPEVDPATAPSAAPGMTPAASSEAAQELAPEVAPGGSPVPGAAAPLAVPTESSSPAAATDLTGMTDADSKPAKKVKVKRPKRDKPIKPSEQQNSFIVPSEQDLKPDNSLPAAGQSPKAPESTEPRTEMPEPVNESTSGSSANFTQPAASPAPVSTSAGSESSVPSPGNNDPVTNTQPPAAETAVGAPPVGASSAPSPEAADANDTSSNTTRKHKHILRKKHESSESHTIYKTVDPESADTSDLKEKPTTNLPDTSPDTMPSQ